MTNATRSQSRRRVIAVALLVGALAAAPASAQPLAVQQLGDGVSIEILELKKISPEIVGLTFAIVNETDEPVRPRAFGVASTAARMDSIILLDLENLKQYTVGTGGAACLCSDEVEVPPGGRVEFWAHYAAPDEGVSEIAIQFAVAPPLYDVPISE